MARSAFIDRLRRKDPCPHCGGSGVRPSGTKLATTAERERREEIEQVRRVLAGEGNGDA